MKIKPTLLDWEFIGEMAKRMTEGQEKHPDPFPGLAAYEEMTIAEVEDGLLRHVVANSSGVQNDENGQSHLVAIACRAMMLWRMTA